MQIEHPRVQQRDEIAALLQSNNLPYQDLPEDLRHFRVAIDEGRVVAAIGLEQYDRYGLLRSLVVDAAYRNRKLAEALVAKLEADALQAGLTDMFLLTETADTWFERRNYRRITRDEVPGSLMRSTEFSHVCPASAVVMKKSIGE